MWMRSGALTRVVDCWYSSSLHKKGQQVSTSGTVHTHAVHTHTGDFPRSAVPCWRRNSLCICGYRRLPRFCRGSAEGCSGYKSMTGAWQGRLTDIENTVGGRARAADRPQIVHGLFIRHFLRMYRYFSGAHMGMKSYYIFKNMGRNPDATYMLTREQDCHKTQL